jgi:hypothetical protein
LKNWCRHCEHTYRSKYTPNVNGDHFTGFPMFALAYMGRKRLGRSAFQRVSSAGKSLSRIEGGHWKATFSAHVRQGEHGAPVQNHGLRLQEEFGRIRFEPKRKPQISPLRYPEFPVEVGSVGRHHAPFLERKAHTRPCPALRGRKSGFAPVEMTISFEDKFSVSRRNAHFSCNKTVISTGTQRKWRVSGSNPPELAGLIRPQSPRPARCRRTHRGQRHRSRSACLVRASACSRAVGPAFHRK